MSYICVFGRQAKERASQGESEKIELRVMLGAFHGGQPGAFEDESDAGEANRRDQVACFEFLFKERRVPTKKRSQTKTGNPQKQKIARQKG